MITGDRLRQFITFCAVGLFNTGAYFAIANCLHLLFSLTETVSAYAAYLALVPISFLGHRRLTFASQGAVLGEWTKFCIVQALNLLLIWVVTLLSREGYLAGWQTFAVISVAIPALNFVAFQAWVFARKLATYP
ncbi:GtrA family protein [Mesorhizobium sp.]|uniref:GtrA family protein n=1 Tax=Mesorhizobium sp. TaxID=1871066 RepID=UPI000FE3008F|nr:GtrA family protein [Mesorhizobium sp.]RWH70278.1 MAG: GtrA family protein [Mesorhizobium sp.]RWL23658.1 MAG: GtrA family protein [Mesorhizobium sp.]RWL25728.1 MAG: GtrA family protein [Mesorhizobium sp.]RWL34717.1 MAG: GtrA family protein [Mesorhizobium sp.]RWL42735.1 MAG: GtrA family protein [Mesorhizobium sp.]